VEECATDGPGRIWCWPEPEKSDGVLGCVQRSVFIFLVGVQAVLKGVLS
jgi:hypothetical protein